VRRALASGVAVAVLVCGCGKGGGASSGSSDAPVTVPGELVPAAARTATVIAPPGGTSVSIGSDVVGKALPLLVRRVFDAREPLASYGLDPAVAELAFTSPDGSVVKLLVGAEEFDGSASYVRRDGDARIWLVLDESLAPLLAPAGITR
jgi:hypothetical protein